MGSFAALIGLLFWWPLVPVLAKLIIIALTFWAGVRVSDAIEKADKLHDPGFIVIDEVVGMMITTMFLGDSLQAWFMAFVLFRIFDVLKCWPASVYDKKPGGFAIMIDDVFMALPALAILQLLLYYQLIPIS